MGSISTNPHDHILAIDPDHEEWISHITTACGVDPALAHAAPIVRGYKKIWLWVWVVGSTNYGVRIEEMGQFTLRVRGPQGHILLEHWTWLPGPEDIKTAVRLAGFGNIRTEG